MVAAKLVCADPDRLHIHYNHIIDQPFWPRVFKDMTSAPVLQVFLPQKSTPLALAVVRSQEHGVSNRVVADGVSGPRCG